MALSALGKTAEAHAQFATAMAMRPTSPTREVLQLQLGRTALQLGRHDEALGHLENLLATDPSNKEARYLLAMALIGKDEHARASAILDKLLAEDPNASAYYARALANYGLKRKAEARPISTTPSGSASTTRISAVAGEDRGDALSAAMRILHIGKYFPPVAGGMERFLGDLVYAQRAAGDEVAVLVHGDRRPAPADDPPWLMRCPVWIRLLFTPISPAFPLWLRRAIRHNGPDVLHMHMPNASVFWALLLPSARRIPWVVHWHSDVEPSKFKLSLRLAYPLYRVFERAVLERAECIIASSAQYLEASGPLRPWRHKCHVVPLGVAPARLPEVDRSLASRHWGTSGLRILTVGRLTYYKGFETLVHAVAGVPDMQLVIAGEGEERPVLERTLQRCADIPSGFASRARSTTPRCSSLLASCDVFCLPSRERTEAFGVALLEAMRYGKPLLVSDLAGSGVTWVARDDHNGILVPPDDVDAWRAALASLAGDPERREAAWRPRARSVTDGNSTSERSQSAMTAISTALRWPWAVMAMSRQRARAEQAARPPFGKAISSSSRRSTRPRASQT